MGKQALEGIKVLEFGLYMATPATCALLAHHGAEVIKVETSTRLDDHRRLGPFKDDIIKPEYSIRFHRYNSGKYGITLNLRHPRGVEVARRLVTKVDVVADGFATGSLDRLGLGYEELKKVKPDIIMLSATTGGQTGPLANLSTFGSHSAAFAGFTNLAGLPDRDPVDLYPYVDYIQVHFNLLTLLAALDYRRRTGKGQHIDISHLEPGIGFLSPLVLDYIVNKRVAERMGNRSPYAAPHGLYRCLGDDRWCAIAVFTDEEWRSLCRVMGDPEWTKDAKFATLMGRKENEDELDRRIESWTNNYSPEEVMTLMQAAGVAAGVVKNGRDIFYDPQLNHRHNFWMLNHSIIGDVPYRNPFCKLSKTPGEVRMPAPNLGEHNEYVYTKLLGMSNKEYAELLAEGVFK